MCDRVSPNVEDPGRGPPIGRVLLLSAITIYIAAFILGAYYWGLDGTALHWWSDLAWTIASFATALMCFGTARRVAGHYRQAWWLFGFGCLAWFAGMLVWDYLELAQGESTPFPALSDIGYMALAPFFMAGLISYRAEAQTAGMTLKQASNLGLIFCTIIIVLLLILVEPLRTVHESWLYRASAVAYPALYMSVFFFGLAYLLLYAWGPYRKVLGLLLLGIAVHAITDTLYAYALLGRAYSAGAYLDVYWLAGFGFICWAAYEQRLVTTHAPPRDAGRRRLDRQSGAIEALLPALSLLSIALVTVLFRKHLDQDLLTYAFPVAAALAVFLVLREWAIYQIEHGLLTDVRRSEERSRLILDSAAEAIYGVDMNNNCSFANAACLRLLGFQHVDELLGKNMHTLIHPADSDNQPHSETDCVIVQGPRAGRNTHRERETLRRKDGTLLDVELWASPIRVEDKIVGAVVNFVDITERRRAEAQMRKLSTALEQIADAVLIANRQGTIEYVNPAFEALTGFTQSEVVGGSPNVLKSGQHGEEFYHSLWQRLLAGKTCTDVFINRKKDGAIYYEQKTITPLRDGAGNITHFISAGKDITPWMQAQERLHYLSHHDVLTDLPNRALLADRLQQALSRAQRHSGYVAVLFIDLDRFKIINDNLGHNSGDSVLQTVAERLLSCMRQEDTVARVGGDEFAVVLEEINTVPEVVPVVGKILEAIAPACVLDGRELYITASMGISLYPGDGDDPQTLIKHADVAMHRAKEQGRNTYQFYSADMSERAAERFNLEYTLRHALEREQFYLCYQPQVDIGTGRVIGAEALLRWRHPERGLVSPEEFIPVLEDSGMIIPVGMWVLRSAFAQALTWRGQGMPDVRMAVNLSSRQLEHPGLVKDIQRSAAEYGFDLHNLELEITESMLMKHDRARMEMLWELVGLGVTFSIDDFGTGYSSLSYLKRLPIHVLKIDRSFITDVTRNPDDAAIVRAIIAMAQSLKLNVIAEGVETTEQLDFLRGAGCHGAQGYLIARPLPGNDAAQAMRQLGVHI